MRRLDVFKFAARNRVACPSRDGWRRLAVSAVAVLFGAAGVSHAQLTTVPAHSVSITTVSPTATRLWMVVARSGNISAARSMIEISSARFAVIPWGATVLIRDR